MINNLSAPRVKLEHNHTREEIRDRLARGLYSPKPGASSAPHSMRRHVSGALSHSRLAASSRAARASVNLPWAAKASASLALSATEQGQDALSVLRSVFRRRAAVACLAEPRRAVAGVADAPLRRRARRAADRTGDGARRQPLCRQQHDPGALAHPCSLLREPASASSGSRSSAGRAITVALGIALIPQTLLDMTRMRA